MWWLLFMFWERLQVDLLIFYREDGTDAYTGPIYAAATQKPGVDFAGAAQNAMNMLNPQNAANKFNALKNKTLSTINEVTTLIYNNLHPLHGEVKHHVYDQL